MNASEPYARMAQPVGQHLLQARRALRHHQVDAVVGAQEQPDRVVPGRRARLGQPDDHGDERATHGEREAAAGGVLVAKVAVLVAQDRAKLHLLHAVEQADTDDQAALAGGAAHRLPQPAALGDRHVGVRGQIRAVHRARADGARDRLEQVAEPGIPVQVDLVSQLDLTAADEQAAQDRAQRHEHGDPDEEHELDRDVSGGQEHPDGATAGRHDRDEQDRHRQVEVDAGHRDHGPVEAAEPALLIGAVAPASPEAATRSAERSVRRERIQPAASRASMTATHAPMKMSAPTTNPALGPDSPPLSRAAGASATTRLTRAARLVNCSSGMPAARALARW